MKLALYSLVALMLAGPVLAQAPPPLAPLPPPQVLLAGRKLDLQPAPVVRDGALVGPWGALARAMGARVSWYADESLLTITGPAGKRLQVQPGQPLVIGKDKVALTPPAMLIEGKLVGPLKPLIEALDVILRWDSKTQQARLWGKVLRLQTRGDEEGVGVSVVTSLPVSPTLQAAPAPRRSFIDLPGILTGGQPDVNYVNLSGLLRVRCGQLTKDPPVTRVVLDLADDAPAAQYQPREDDLGGRIVVGRLDGDEPIIERLQPKLLKVLAASHEPDTLTVTAFVSDPIEPVYDVLRQPYRVLLDLAGAETAACLMPAATQLPFLGEIKLMAQGRLVLYMDELVPFTVTALRDPDRLQLAFRRDRLAGKKIMVDAGHGGKDSGARGQTLLEKNINLDVAKRTAQRLALMGAHPVMTRDSDVFIGLYDRPRMTNELPADLFVSIHCNATGSSWVGTGTGTYYCHPQSKELAVVMQDALAPVLRRQDTGVHRERFCVVRETQIPAVLVELLFIDNPVEEKLLAMPEVRQQAAAGICEGLRRYLEGTKSPAPALLTEPEG